MPHRTREYRMECRCYTRQVWAAMAVAIGMIIVWGALCRVVYVQCKDYQRVNATR